MIFNRFDFKELLIYIQYLIPIKFVAFQRDYPVLVRNKQVYLKSYLILMFRGFRIVIIVYVYNNIY